MRKKRVCGKIIIIAMLIIISVVGFAGCSEKEVVAREIIIELLHPETGEPMLNKGTRFTLLKEKTPIVARIRDKETGVELKDSDLIDNTVKNSINISVTRLSISEDHYGEDMGFIGTGGYWPTDVWYYEILVRFDCLSNHVSRIRKYEYRSEYFRFHVDYEKGE